MIHSKENSQVKQSHFKALILGLAITLFQIQLLANSGFNLISIHSKETSSFILHFPAAMQSTYEVVLMDANRVVLYTEKIEKGIEKKIYNLKKLPDGEYVLCISYDNITKWEHLLIQNRTIRIEENVKTVAKPTVLLNEGHLDFNMLCFSQNKIQLSIWDDSGHLLLKEYFDANGNIQKRYNLKKLREGEYYVSVSLPHELIDFEYNKRIHWVPKTNL